MPLRFSVLHQYLIPKQALTRLAGRVAGAQGSLLTPRLIRWFAKKYGVDMSEARNPDLAGYASFNDFFTRALRADARPLADADFVCPVDGAISQCGGIERDQIIQAKGHRYSTTALVGGDAGLAALFDHGSFATLYLSPRDYHRIHMPCDARLTRMIYVPGALFSVNPTTARGVPGLFARNERVVCVFESAFGPFALVLVGATIVGSMATVWHGVVNASRSGRIREWRYDDREIALKKGEEMGRFLLGSTVVLLFPRGVIEFNPAWAAERTIRMGEAMGRKPGEARFARPSRDGAPVNHQRILEFSTSGRGTLDITGAVADVVAASGVRTGLAHVFVQHTSCSLTITENADPDVRRDLETLLARLAPDGDPAYRHDLEGPDDMAAHARSVLTGTGLTVPVGAGRLLLGTWQGIYLWEHRTGAQRRRVAVTVLGG